MTKLRKSGMGEVGQEWASMENTLGRAGGLSVEGGKKEGGQDVEVGYMGSLGWFMGGNTKIQDPQGIESSTPDRYGDRDAGEVSPLLPSASSILSYLLLSFTFSTFLPSPFYFLLPSPFPLFPLPFKLSSLFSTCLHILHFFLLDRESSPNGIFLAPAPHRTGTAVLTPLPADDGGMGSNGRGTPPSSDNVDVLKELENISNATLRETGWFCR